MYQQLAHIHVGDPDLDYSRLDPDLLGQIRILQRAMAVRGWIFQPRSQIGIRFISNPPDLSNKILHLWISNSMDRSFETANVHTEKWICQP
jgi:hypothetical protein